MKYVSNSFSPKMLNGKGSHKVTFKQISKQNFDKNIVDAYSIIGHKAIAQRINKPFNRESIKLKHGDILYLVLSSDKRLPEDSKLNDTSSLYYVKCIV